MRLRSGPAGSFQLLSARCLKTARPTEQTINAKRPNLRLCCSGNIGMDIPPAKLRAQKVNGSIIPSQTPPNVQESIPRAKVSTYHWQIGRAENDLSLLLEAPGGAGDVAIQTTNAKQSPTPIASQPCTPDQRCHTGAWKRKIAVMAALPVAKINQPMLFCETSSGWMSCNASHTAMAASSVILKNTLNSLKGFPNQKINTKPSRKKQCDKDRGSSRLIMKVAH